ncbi:glycoside hydrolase family 28 protein [Telmatobacter bradus]|uniref:glycoside hydrolase family 28 protein n=1 Tax=Telmatobacter bradus TaxID=474953 RepID=UPI003B42F2EA
MLVDRRAFLLSSSFTVLNFSLRKQRREFDVHRFGAVGDGKSDDTAAVQKAIEAATLCGGRVVLRGGFKYLCGALMLKDHIDFHLADDATILAHTAKSMYPPKGPGVISSNGAINLKISGTGIIDGQGKEFVTNYSDVDERWDPKGFRARMFSLHEVRDLEVSGIRIQNAPFWGLHMLGCERVLVDGITIRNWLDMPNCDGIDPDHCRDVEIRNCDIVCADDAICVKTTQQDKDYGPSHNIYVHDCVVTTRDSGLKVGTETFGDISKVKFERCKVLSGGRGPTITHRQPGNIWDIEFNDIEVKAEHHAARWWGWGEPISLTAWPRIEGVKVGSIRDVRLRNIRASAENSVHIGGQPDQPLEDILLENVEVTIDTWTHYPGGKLDKRPTMPGVEGLEPHATNVFTLHDARNVTLRGCTAKWGETRKDYYGVALEAVHVENLKIEDFHGEAAFPDRQKPIVIR